MRQLDRVRRQLQKEQSRAVEESSEALQTETENEMLQAMICGEKLSRHKAVSRLLRIFPEEEYDVVKDYWALQRVVGMEIETESWEDPIPVLRSELNKKRQEAFRQIKDRLTVKEKQDHYFIRDPISKYQMEFHESVHGDLDMAKTKLATEVLNG